MTIIALPPLERTLPALLTRQADRFGDRPLVTVGGQTWTLRQARDIAARRGGSLRQAGIQRGDRVAALCGNTPELLELALGCGWIGAILVPLNTAAMGPQIGYYLRDSGARLLVIEHRLSRPPRSQRRLPAPASLGSRRRPRRPDPG